MSSSTQILSIKTTGQGLYEFTDQIIPWVASKNIANGLLTVFCRHTSASLVIQENADPDVLYDLKRFFQKLVLEDPSLYRHTCEGPDDMPAHIKSALTNVSLTIPVLNGQLGLGTWQGIYLFEHRSNDHTREIIVSLTN